MSYVNLSYKLLQLEDYLCVLNYFLFIITLKIFIVIYINCV
jgi:hypothetical protein